MFAFDCGDLTLTTSIRYHCPSAGPTAQKKAQVGKDQEKAQSEKDSHFLILLKIKLLYDCRNIDMGVISLAPI